VAFIIVNEHYNETKDSLISKMRIPLPDYMVPRFFKLVKEFPLTPNGKIDRKLMNINLEDFNTLDDKPAEKPVTTDVERKVLDIWIQELGMSNIGINDNFFDIGGNSILLIQLSDQINKILGKKIDVLHYFQYPTIKSFCSYLSKVDTLQNSSSENKLMDQRSRQIQNRRRLKPE
jgi:acyl carrier protein